MGLFPVRTGTVQQISDDHIPSSQPKLHSPRNQLNWSYLCFDLLLSQTAPMISCAGDLKPDNIFFDSQGVLKLGDFGLAKFQPVPGDPALSGIVVIARPVADRASSNLLLDSLHVRRCMGNHQTARPLFHAIKQGAWSLWCVLIC